MAQGPAFRERMHGELFDYLPGLRAPYYIYIGRKRRTSRPASTLPAQ